MKRLRIGQLLLSKKSTKKNNVLAMIAARIIQPQSKLATTRWWETTTLPEEFEVVETTPERLYASLDWLVEAQPRIEKKLAKRHLRDGQLVLYDLSSSYVEGTCCPLAKRGYSRDKKTRKKILFEIRLHQLSHPREPSKSAQKKSFQMELQFIVLKHC